MEVMNIKVFNIRLTKEHCQNDQNRMNEFLNSVEVKLASTSFVTTGTIDFWSATVFFEPKVIQKGKKELKLLEEELVPNERKIFRALRSWRKDFAEKLSWPTYTICHNSHLIAIAKANPQTLQELENISSFGKTRADKYGADIIAVLNAL
jgi:superfamily II DNA helicase RecQ